MTSLALLTCYAFCNLCNHLYQCVYALPLQRESVHLFLSLSQNMFWIDRDLQLVIFPYCERYNKNESIQ